MNRTITAVAGRPPGRKKRLASTRLGWRRLQFGDLPPQLPRLAGLRRRHPRSLPGIDLNLTHPLAHRLRRPDPQPGRTALIAANSDGLSLACSRTSRTAGSASPWSNSESSPGRASLTTIEGTHAHQVSSLGTHVSQMSLSVGDGRIVVRPDHCAVRPPRVLPEHASRSCREGRDPPLRWPSYRPVLWR